MGSDSDWPIMMAAAETFKSFGVPYEAKVLSAHRTPDLLFDYARAAGPRGMKAIIAGAGGAAHLPGMLAAKTIVPVLGVPVQSKALPVWTRCFPSCRCRKASRSRPSPSAKRGGQCGAVSPSPCWPTTMPALRSKLQAFRTGPGRRRCMANEARLKLPG